MQMFEHTDILQTNVTVGRLYMQQMSRSAARNGITIELCTSYPRHSLASLEMPTVTVVNAY